MNDPSGAVVAAVKALVVEEPGVDILHDGADGAEPGAMIGPFMPDHGPDALTQAEPAVIGAVVAGIGEKGGRSPRRRPGPGAAVRGTSWCH